jgi:hypothetical protein
VLDCSDLVQEEDFLAPRDDLGSGLPGHEMGDGGLVYRKLVYPLSSSDVIDHGYFTF